MERVRALREHPRLIEATWVALTLNVDPVLVLRETDEWAYAARVAAAELIEAARRKAERH